METVVGKVGELTVRIPTGERPGEVLITVDGVRETYFAHFRRELPVGRRVLVVGDRGDRNVDVEPWDAAI